MKLGRFEGSDDGIEVGLTEGKRLGFREGEKDGT